MTALHRKMAGKSLVNRDLVSHLASHATCQTGSCGAAIRQAPRTTPAQPAAQQQYTQYLAFMSL